METWPVKPRVLVAGERSDHERVDAILSGYVRRFAGSLEEAVRALEDREFALVIIGQRFAAAAELAQWLRARGPQGSIAVARIDRHGLPPGSTPEHFGSASCPLPLDLRRFPQDHRGNRRLRRVLDELIERRHRGDGSEAAGAARGAATGSPRAP